MDSLTEDVRLKLVRLGMQPNRFGKLGRKTVEFVSYPWTSGYEIFVMVREQGRPNMVSCVGADEVTVI